MKSVQEEFERKGWVYLPKFFADDVVSELNRQVSRLGEFAEASLRDGVCLEDEAANPGLMVVPELRQRDQVCRYEYIFGVAPELKRALVPRVSSAIAEIAGEPFLPFKDKVNNKYPGGGGYPPHQDFVAYESFGPRIHVTAMITIDPATLENGCLYVTEDYRDFVAQNPESVFEWIEGRPILRSHDGGNRNGDILEEIADKIPWFALPMHPSDLLLFDSFVPHFSRPNASSASRRAMFLTFSPASAGDHYERYYAEKRNNPLDPKFHKATPTRHATTTV